MQSMNHQLMGYDRAITMFSPDGRLLQVEYAKKTVKQGSTAIGIATKNGVILCTDKRIIDKLVVPESIEKIFQIDDHIAATASGIISDARILVERAQLKSQQFKVTYDSPIDTLSIVKDLANLKQMCTQSGGLRPFGVSLLVAGVDEDKPYLFVTDPTGIYFEYKAAAIGEGQAEAEKVLTKDYNADLSVEDAIKLGIKAIANAVPDITIERLDCVYLNVKDKKFTRVKPEDISETLDSVKSKIKKEE